MPDQLLINNEVIGSLRHAFGEGDHGLKSVPGLLERVIDEKMWQERYEPRLPTGKITFKYFEDFALAPPLEGLGADLDMLFRICSDNLPIFNKLNEVATAKPGGYRPPKSIIDNINNGKAKPADGTSRRQGLLSLSKHAPKLHKRVLAGELTVNAAMIEAGLRKKKIPMPVEVPDLARVLRNKLDPAERKELIRLLSDPD